jgi:hypothetical protein
MIQVRNSSGLHWIGWDNPIRTEVYFCHQNQNVINIGNFTTLLKPHNIGTHLKGIETSFQVVPLVLKFIHVWVSCITFWNFLLKHTFNDNVMLKVLWAKSAFKIEEWMFCPYEKKKMNQRFHQSTKNQVVLGCTVLPPWFAQNYTSTTSMRKTSPRHLKYLKFI